MFRSNHKGQLTAVFKPFKVVTRKKSVCPVWLQKTKWWAEVTVRLALAPQSNSVLAKRLHKELCPDAFVLRLSASGRREGHRRVPWA